MRDGARVPPYPASPVPHLSPPMKPPAVVAAFEEALGQLGVEVRRERGGFRGGLCVVEGAPTVVLNKLHPPEAQAAVLAEAIRQRGGADALYLRPSVRQALDDAWAASGPVEAPDGD